MHLNTRAQKCTKQILLDLKEEVDCNNRGFNVTFNNVQISRQKTIKETFELNYTTDQMETQQK